ncbi:uncharacterized protein KIAA1958 homolog [Dreissena polymorpha]|uniref:uncharacterized protein KIAA1958 homolog n=1 Tax=Dreissena polymorpha TaxID=45954 RepID=UPI002264CE54|nr:uncharacterized protein KIAA1958 homolog [Dreissena polymorpha]
MSDEFDKVNFSLTWDEINNEHEQQAAEVELTLSQFQEQYGFDPSILFTNEIELTIENETSPSSNAPSSSNVFPPTLDLHENKEFLDVNLTDVGDFIVQNENKKTVSKTLSDINKFKRFLMSKAESKEIHHIEPTLLDEYLATFLLSLKKSNGTDFEPSSLRGIIASVDRYLKRHRYGCSVMTGTGAQFALTRDTYNAKKKSLKKQGMGNRPREAHPLSDTDIDLLWEKGILGTESPKALLNTVWLNKCLHFGLRGGETSASV